MQFTVTSDKPARHRTECAVCAVYASRQLSESAKQLDRASRGQLADLVKSSSLDGGLGQSLTVHGLRGVKARRIVLVGLGARTRLDAWGYRKALRKAADAVIESGAAGASLFFDEVEIPRRDDYWKLRQAIELVSEQLYRFDELKSKKARGPRPKLRRVQLAADEARVDRAADALEHGEAVAAGVALARDLGNRPGNVCTPSHLAAQARDLAKRHARVTARVVEESEMKRLGMGALLSVSRGSREPPKLIVLQYRGADRDEKPIALLGKGVTFDSGGISIKPSQAMDEMKFDMCGAASVLGTVEAAARLELALNIVALVPATENLPDGNASKPGDVVTTCSGQTVEILNTDAEGRLILCDALTYAARFKPGVVIDVATLTGACVVALGAHAHGLFSNDDALAEELLAAGDYSGDRGWRLPVWPEYEEALRSNFADLANVGGREAGAVTAARFLLKFASAYRWAHLDIAGTAWTSGKAKGATGRPVPLLCQFLLARAGLAG